VSTRIEEEGDYRAIRAVNIAAFDTAVEACLVEVLRQQARPLVSIVAEESGNVIGHIMFSPVTHSNHPDLNIMGLGPMSVVPSRQRAGIGSTLVREGLNECKNLGFAAVVVLGHPSYYPRFGFSPASTFDIRSEYDVPDEVFMAMELQPNTLNGKSGIVRYHNAFDRV